MAGNGKGSAGRRAVFIQTRQIQHLVCRQRTMQTEIPKEIGRDAMRSRRKPLRRSSVPTYTGSTRQLPLPIGPPPPPHSNLPPTASPAPPSPRAPDANLASDQVLKTRQVMQIAGCHRSTIPPNACWHFPAATFIQRLAAIGHRTVVGGRTQALRMNFPAAKWI